MNGWNRELKRNALLSPPLSPLPLSIFLLLIDVSINFSLLLFDILLIADIKLSVVYYPVSRPFLVFIIYSRYIMYMQYISFSLLTKLE